jgi:hypothetical protein
VPLSTYFQILFTFIIIDLSRLTGQGASEFQIIIWRIDIPVVEILFWLNKADPVGIFREQGPRAYVTSQGFKFRVKYAVKDNRVGPLSLYAYGANWQAGLKKPTEEKIDESGCNGGHIAE